jgi:hypothetical protein
VGLIPSLALAVAAVAVLVAVQVHHVRTVKAQRRAVLDDVAPLFSELEISQQGIDFPSLTGVYDGDRIKLQLVVDTLAMRQLPRLWLMVTVVRRLAIANPVEILLRPRTSDIVSSGSRLPYEHEPPPGWPADSRISTRAAAAPPYDAFAEVLPALHDPLTKALLVAPGGVRIVHELARGDISRHRVIRRAKFDAHVERARLMGLIELARDVARDVDVAQLERMVSSPA